MAFVENWVETDPDGAVITVSVLDDWIRKTKVATRERMEGDAALNLTGLIESGTWATGPVPKQGSARASAVTAANLGTVPLQDGRIAITTDTNRLYHMKASGYVELAYAALTGATFSGVVAFNAGMSGTLSTAAQPAITSVGTLTSLTISSGTQALLRLTGAHAWTINAFTDNNLYFSDSTTALDYWMILGTGGHILPVLDSARNIGDVTHKIGTLTAVNITGTILTAAQPNITTLGTLTTLAVTGQSIFQTAAATNVTLNTTTGGAGDFTQILFQRGGVIKWRIGTNIDGSNIDRMIFYNDALGTYMFASNATGVVTSVFGFSGNISGNLTGTVLTAAQGNITSLGTLTGLTTGNLTVSAAGASELITSTTVTNATYLNFRNGGGDYYIGIDTSTGSVFGSGSTYQFIIYTPAGLALAINKTSNTAQFAAGVTATSFTGSLVGNLTGTVLTAAQGNITSLGTLTTLSVSGTVSGIAGFSTTAAVAQINLNTTAGNATDQSRISFQRASVDKWFIGEIPNAATDDFTIAKGDGTTAIGINFTTKAVSIPNGLTANVTGNVTGSAATVTTAAQPAITSVGTLTGLAVSGTSDFGTGHIAAGTSTSVTAVTTIYTIPANSGALVIVFGDNGAGAQFVDLVMAGSSSAAVTVVSSVNIVGSPAVRTYSMSSGLLRLAMASGTYTVKTMPHYVI